MKKMKYWLWVPFLFIIIYSVMVNKLDVFPFSWVEGMTGERSITLKNSAGNDETVYVNDRVAAKSGPKKGIEAGIVAIDDKGNLHVSYNINQPNQNFVVGEYVVAARNNKGTGGIKGKVTSVNNGLINVSYDSGVSEVYLSMDLLMYYTPDQVMVVRPAPYTFAIGDTIIARVGTKAWNTGKVVDINPSGGVFVNHDTSAGMQRFMKGDSVAASSGPNKLKVGVVIAVDPSSTGNAVVEYPGGTSSEYKQTELLWYYLKTQVQLKDAPPSTSGSDYNPMIGDKVVANIGTKAGIEGEITDIGGDVTDASPGRFIYVTYNTTIPAQKFVVGDWVAAKSGDNTRRVGKVTSVATNGDVSVIYDGLPVNGVVKPNTATFKQTELQMFYLRMQVSLKSRPESPAKSTPSYYTGSYDPSKIDTVYHTGNIIYYKTSYDSSGKIVYTPTSWTQASTTSGSSSTTGTAGSDTTESVKGASTGSSRGNESVLDDSLILGENSILADYTSPPDSAKSTDAKVDTKAPVADADTLNKIYQLLNSLIERNHCTVSTYGCCKDNITAKKDVPGSNCSETRAVGLSDDVKKYIDTAVSEKTFTFTPQNSSLLQTSLASPPTNQLSTQASYTNTVFLAPPHGNYMYPGKCPNPADCNTPTYSNVNSDKLPLPLVSDFSKFGN